MRFTGRARVDPKNPRAFAVCDRCGLLYNLKSLVAEMEWRGPRLMETGYLVCTVTCLDVPQEQLRPRILPPDPVPVFNPRPEAFAVEDGLQGFTLYTLDPPPFYGSAAPVYSENYVLEQLAAISGNPIPVTTDFSSIITASQVPQSLVPGAADRSFLALFNPTSAPLAVSFGTAAFGSVTSIMLYTGQALYWNAKNGLISLADMTIVGFRPNQPYYAWQSGVGQTLLANDNGVLLVLPAANYPTDPSGLQPGAVWANGGPDPAGVPVAVVDGGVPKPGVPDLFFGQVTAAQLQFYGGQNLPMSEPTPGSLQLWNNGGEIAIAVSNESTFLDDDGGLLVVLAGAGYPTDPTGLPPGAVWDNGGAVTVVPGGTPQPGVPDLFYGSVTAAQLQVYGGQNLPLTPPSLGSLQLWNNGGLVSIA